jgi:hypothetical protein
MRNGCLLNKASEVRQNERSIQSSKGLLAEQQGFNYENIMRTFGGYAGHVERENYNAL